MYIVNSRTIIAQIMEIKWNFLKWCKSKQGKKGKKSKDNGTN